MQPLQVPVTNNDIDFSTAIEGLESFAVSKNAVVDVLVAESIDDASKQRGTCCGWLSSADGSTDGNPPREVLPTLTRI